MEFAKNIKRGVKLFVIFICLMNFYVLYLAGDYVYNLDYNLSFIDDSKTELVNSVKILGNVGETFDIIIDTSTDIKSTIISSQDRLKDLSAASNEFVSYADVLMFDGSYFQTQSTTFLNLANDLDNTVEAINFANDQMLNLKDVTEKIVRSTVNQIANIPDSYQVSSKLDDIKFKIYLFIIYLSIINVAFLSLVIIT